MWYQYWFFLEQKIREKQSSDAGKMTQERCEALISIGVVYRYDILDEF